MIPGPTPPAIAWAASPLQRAKWSQAALSIPRVRRKPLARVKADSIELPLGENLSDAAKQCPKLADYWFASKQGRTLSEGAIRLLRLKGWLEICLSDQSLESEVFTTECRLREQAAYIIGWGA